MLDKIIFQNGVVVKAEYLNEVQKGSTISTTDPRINFYGSPTDLDHDSWPISYRDSIKDWEMPHPDIEPETNIGRLAHDAVLWGCVNCSEDDIEPIEVSFNYAPTTTRKNLDNTPLPNGQIGVIVSSGRVLGEDLQILEWPTTIAVVEPNSTNYIYAYYDNSDVIVVANSVLPSRATLYTPIAQVDINQEGQVVSVVDLRHGVYIDSLLSRSNNLRNTEIINTNTTIQVWDRAVVDTANGEIYITLPPNAVNNDLVSVVDAVGTFNEFPVHILPNGDQKINNSLEPLMVSKSNAQVNMFFFEPLNTWLFVDDFLAESYKDLGEFISCGGMECIGVTEPSDCPDGRQVPPVFPNPSEGLYYYDSNSSKCYKKISTDIAVYSDGEGGFTKIFKDLRCKKSQTLPGKSQIRTIKVSLSQGDDNIQNDGVITPFKTIERALLESAKRRGDFDKLSIEVDADSYHVDNTIGASYESLRTFDDSGLYFRTYTNFNVGFIGSDYILAIHNNSDEVLSDVIPRGLELGRVIYTESGANAVISSIKRKQICTNDCGWILELRYISGEMTMNERIYFDNFSVLNPASGGIIVPNGVSLVSSDLRKTKILPRYVPSIRDNSQGQTSIFKLTGNTYINGFTFTDNETFTESHTKLSAFEFVSEQELEEYYLEKLKSLFEYDFTYNADLDINEVGIVYPEDITILSRLTDNYENITGTMDIQSELEPVNGDSAPYTQNGFIYYPGKIKFEGFIIPDVNNIRGASPYIKTCTVRSNFGLSGALIDGSKVKGTKSMVISEFTIVSLQLDPECYENNSTTYYNLPTDSVNPKQYKSEEIYRSFGFKVVNDGYAQIVSCFVIGASDHFVTKSGGEMSVSNSCSNFGDKSLVTSGFKAFSYPQDFSKEVDLGAGFFGTRLSKVIRPLPLSLETYKVSTRLSIDVNATLAHFESMPLAPTKYRLYIRTSNNQVPSASMMNSGSYSYTTIDPETNEISLSAGLEKAYRNYLCVDAVEYIGGRTLRTSYFAQIDEDSLVYNSSLDDKSQIFKYDPEPPIEEVNVSGTYNLDFDTSTITSSDSSPLPVSFIEGRYFYLNDDKSTIYTIARVDLDNNSASFVPELPSESILNARITFVSNDFLGGLWYVDIKEVEYVGDLSNQFRLSLGLIGDNPPIAQSSVIYTYRDKDTREDSDRIYKIRLKGFDPEFGLRAPQNNYILEANSDYNLDINTDSNPLVISNVSRIEGDEYEAILVTSDKSVIATTQEVFPTKNLDNPELTENPLSSLTYQALNKLANYSLISLESDNLIPSTSHLDVTYINSAAPFVIELRKPSIIRANSHVWEWVGYLNYDSSLQNVQGNLFDDQTYFDKLIDESTGGKIYATGSTEAGKFVIGNQLISLGAKDINLGTPQISGTTESFVSSESFPSSYSFESLGVNEALRMSPFSTLSLDNQSNLQFSSNTPILNEFGNPLSASNFEYDSYANENRAGFIQVATQSEVDAGVSNLVVVTPQTLENKKATNTSYGVSKLADVSETREWLLTGSGDNPTNVITNEVLGQNLVEFNKLSSIASDLWFTHTISRDIIYSAESTSLFVWGSYVSLWVNNTWAIVQVPEANEFNLQAIGANQGNTIYRVYAYLDNQGAFKLQCFNAETTTNMTMPNGVVVKDQDPTYRFIGEVYTYTFNSEIYTSLVLGGTWSSGSEVVPRIYYSNFLKPRTHTLNLILEDDFPRIVSSMLDWDSPASANASYAPGTSYAHAPKISFLTSRPQFIKTEATLLTYYEYDTPHPDPFLEYCLTSLGINMGTHNLTSPNDIHPNCFTGTTTNRFESCRATLNTQATTGFYDVLYLFKTLIVGTHSINIIHNKDLQTNGLHYGLRLTLEA